MSLTHCQCWSTIIKKNQKLFILVFYQYHWQCSTLIGFTVCLPHVSDHDNLCLGSQQRGPTFFSSTVPNIGIYSHMHSLTEWLTGSSLSKLMLILKNAKWYWKFLSFSVLSWTEMFQKIRNRFSSFKNNNMWAKRSDICKGTKSCDSLCMSFFWHPHHC